MWIKIGIKFIEDDTKDKNTSYFGIFRPMQKKKIFWSYFFTFYTLLIDKNA